jgi:hypothetical protein
MCHRFEIWRGKISGPPDLIAYIEERGVDADHVDMVDSFSTGMDPMTGTLNVRMTTKQGGIGTPMYEEGTEVFSIQGFATLFDVLQSFTPTTAALDLAVPAMPEGLRGADHFDTFWGPLIRPFTFSNAQPLQCGYPALPPKPGDYITVMDTVPTPAVGEGVYYVTAASYQGQTRFGRRYMNGAFSGRDPSVLPACR